MTAAPPCSDLHPKKTLEGTKVRVLQVFHGLGLGGAETWLIDILRYLRQHKMPVGIEFDICLTGGKPEAFDAEAKALGAELHYIKFGRKHLCGFAGRFRTLLRERGYSAIHDHQDYVAGFHFLAGIGRLPPVRLAHVHNPSIHFQHYASTPGRKASILLGRYLMRKYSTGIVGTSHQLLAELGYTRRPYEKLNMGAVYCGFDTSRFIGNHEFVHREICLEFGWNPEVRIVLFVGRLGGIDNLNTNQKNPEFALEAARHCLERDRSMRFLFAGAGEAVKVMFEQRIRDWGLSSEIRMIGPRNDIPRLMAGTNLLLFPSRQEGLGMVSVEAQASGLPVLASDSIPAEATVIPNIVRILPLSAGADFWGKEAVRITRQPRPDPLQCNRAVAVSPFSIENSVNRLIKLYTNPLGVPTMRGGSGSVPCN